MPDLVQDHAHRLALGLPRRARPRSARSRSTTTTASKRLASRRRGKRRVDLGDSRALELLEHELARGETLVLVQLLHLAAEVGAAHRVRPVDRPGAAEQGPGPPADAVIWRGSQARLPAALPSEEMAKPSATNPQSVDRVAKEQECYNLAKWPNSRSADSPGVAQNRTVSGRLGSTVTGRLLDEGCQWSYRRFQDSAGRVWVENIKHGIYWTKS